MKFNNKYFLSGENIEIGKNVRIGDNTIIYGNSYIDDDAIIGNDCIIGEPSTDYYFNDEYLNRKTTIGRNCLIRSHSIIYNGNTLGEFVTTGHRIILREDNNIGANCRIGNFTELHGNVIIGRYSNLHSNVCIVENSIIGSFVWISPGTILTNDLTLPSDNKLSPVIGDFTAIAVNCVILPGVKTGRNCLIGASSVVTRDIGDYTVVFGIPARVVADIRDYKIKGIGHYPWPKNYDKGMPWEGKDFEEWINNSGTEYVS